MRVWRVMPRTDNLGNNLWSLQYDRVYSDGERDGLWREDRVFRDLDMALADLQWVRNNETTEAKE